MTDVKFLDTSDWQILRGLSSGGTREKRVLQDDNGAKWYFKCSERKPGLPGQPEKYYKYEFWSEVIAYQLGKNLDLDVLRYDVGYSEGDVGCISPEMDAAADEQLVEVGRYMTIYNPTFAPDDTQARKEYTFQLLENTIKHFELEEYWPSFLKTLVFDALIGNTDRHQENWAFISSAYTSTERNHVELNSSQEKALKDLLASLDDDSFSRRLEEYKLRITLLKRVAPIYDSGSSLARELNEEKVKRLFEDEEQLQRYINRGGAEVHWNRQKKSHFELLQNILAGEHANLLKESGSFLYKWNQVDVEHLITHIDGCIPPEHAEFKIPLERKNLIVKLLTLRHRRVVDIIYG